MPTVPRSPATSIHSWSFVYLKPAGYAIGAHRSGSAALLRSLVERHRHDARARAPAADVDVELGARRPCASTGTYAMPIAFFRNGVCVPLVTTPTFASPT